MIEGETLKINQNLALAPDLGIMIGTSYLGRALIHPTLGVGYASAAAEVFTSTDGGSLVVSFRGTDFTPGNAPNDTFIPDLLSYGALFNGSYFRTFSPLLDAVIEYAEAFGIDYSNIFFTGHSLGAGAVNNLIDSEDYGETFKSSKFFSLATPVVSQSKNILNFAHDNDVVFAATHDLSVIDEGYYPNSTDNVLAARFSVPWGIDTTGDVFNGSENTSAHSTDLYVATIEAILDSPFYDQIAQDDYVIYAIGDVDLNDFFVEENFEGGDVYLVGTRGDGRTIVGSDRDDHVSSPGSSDTFRLSGPCSEYDAELLEPGVLRITHARGTGRDGDDVVRLFQFLEFSDRTISIGGREDEVRFCTDLTPVSIVPYENDWETMFDDNALDEDSDFFPVNWARTGDISYEFGAFKEITVYIDDSDYALPIFRGSNGGSLFESGGDIADTGLRISRSLHNDIERSILFLEDSLDISLSGDVIFELRYDPFQADLATSPVFVKPEDKGVPGGYRTEDFVEIRFDRPTDEPEPEPKEASVFGDPHLVTFDGLAYSFQASGEYILTRTTSGNEYEVQVRFEPNGSSLFSGTTAVATEVASMSVVVDAKDEFGTVWIDGIASQLMDGETIEIGLGSASRNENSILLVNEFGDETTIDLYAINQFFNVIVKPGLSREDGSFEGLLGNADGLLQNDFQLSDGTQMPPRLDFSVLYNEFAKSWLVPDAARLLNGERQVFGSPEIELSIDSFPMELVENARALVSAAGIENETLRDAAVFDFLLTGSDEYIQAAIDVSETIRPESSATPNVEEQKPVLILTSDTTTLSEQEETRAATLTVSRSDTEGALSVNYAISGYGVASADRRDFMEGDGFGSVIIRDGEESANFDIEIVDDNLTEGLETFDVAISLTPESAQDFEVIVSSVRFTIEDDDQSPALNKVTGTTDRDYLIGTAADDVFLFKGGYGDAGRGNGGNDKFDLGENLANGALDNTRILDWSDGDMIIGLGLDDVHLETVRSSSTVLRFAYGEDDDVLTITGAVPSSVESLFGVDQIA